MKYLILAIVASIAEAVSLEMTSPYAVVNVGGDDSWEEENPFVEVNLGNMDEYDKTDVKVDEKANTDNKGADNEEMCIDCNPGMTTQTAGSIVDQPTRRIESQAEETCPRGSVQHGLLAL